MRQSLEILQANTVELNHIIQQALVTNPVLEDETTTEQLEEETIPDEEHDHELLSQMDEDWRELSIIENRNRTSSADDEARREFMYNSIVAPETLQQHLVSQVGTSEVDIATKQAAITLIGSIDDRGFFESPPLELGLGIHVDTLDEAIALIQSFDPIGVGAVDLKECLQLQLERRAQTDTIEYKIISSHLDDLARKKYPHIAKELGTSLERITEAAESISSLNPDPGSDYDATSNPHVAPDVIIDRQHDGSYAARLTNEYLPKLKISNNYKDMIGSLRREDKARSYLRQHIRDGRTLIRAVSQRQETILEIAKLITKYQKDFLDQGPRHLKPMTMNDIADKVGVHATTISRAVAGKYVLTPHGLMETRSFFATGYNTKGGSEVSNAGVREAIQQLIDKEDKIKPLSDSAIEKKLKEEGVKVARRTVAKYREQLNILPSHLRKEFS